MRTRDIVPGMSPEPGASGAAQADARGTVPNGRPARSRSLRIYLLVLTVAWVLPIVAAGGVLCYRFVLSEYNGVQRDVEDRLRLMRSAVELRIGNVIEDLQVLATSPTLAEGRLETFYRHLVAATATMGAQAIVLCERDGQQLVNSRLPFGGPLPKRTELDALNRVLATGQPQVSNLVPAAVDQTPVVTVEVPVVVGGELRYVLEAGLSPQYVNSVLTSYVPTGWIGSVLDRRGIVLARTSDDARDVIGKPTIPEVAARLGAPMALWIAATSRTGEPTYSSFMKSEQIGWTINLALPRKLIDGPLRSAALAAGGLGALAVVLAVLIATLAAQRIVQALTQLDAHVAALGAGRTIDPVPTRVSEIDEMQAVLHGVSRDVVRTRAHLESALHQKELLVGELNHRVKNSLASVQSLARLSLGSAASVKEFVAVFEQRVLALARAYNLLSDADWSGADLKVLVETTLAPYGRPGRVTITGVAVPLPARLAVPMAAALQELSTNAAKYGALSTPTGQLGVSWSVDAANTLDLQWVESGGPVVSPPVRRGFGRKMIEEVLASDVGWTVDPEYRPDGFRCRLAVTLDDVENTEARRAE